MLFLLARVLFRCCCSVGAAACSSRVSTCLSSKAREFVRVDRFGSPLTEAHPSMNEPMLNHDLSLSAAVEEQIRLWEEQLAVLKGAQGIRSLSSAAPAATVSQAAVVWGSVAVVHDSTTSGNSALVPATVNGSNATTDGSSSAPVSGAVDGNTLPAPPSATSPSSLLSSPAHGWAGSHRAGLARKKRSTSLQR